MASATRADGDVAFAKAGENLEPAATAAVEARPQGNAEAKPALAADVVACWARALSIDPWMSRAGRVAAAFVGTRRGAAGVGSASGATGAAIVLGGPLVCWRSIDG